MIFNPYIYINLCYGITPFCKTIITNYTPKKILDKKINPVVFYSMIFSTLHAIYISTNCLLYLTNVINTDNFIYGLNYTMYYMLTDIFIMNYIKDFNTIRIPMSLHHFLIAYNIYKVKYELAFPIFNIITQKELIMYFISRLLLAEIAVIFMNANWFMLKFDRKKNIEFKVSNTLFKISYFIFRICNFTSFTHNYISNYGIDTNSISIGIITLMNISWFSKLIYK